MVVLNAFQSIFSIVIMISVGFILAKKGWFSDEVSKVIARLVTNVSLPPLMVYNLTTSFDRQALLSSGHGLIIPFTSMLICFFISIICSKLLKVENIRRGIFETMFFVSNTIFIGLPVNQSLFGDKSIPYVLLYYIANTLIFWTIGTYEIKKYAEGNKVKLFSIETLKKFTSPPLLGFLAGIVLVLLDIRLPKFIMDSCRQIGNLTTPLSMIFIGITISTMSLKWIKFDFEMLAVFLGRFVISPLTVYILTLLIPIPPLMRNVFVIQAAMPVMTQTAIIARAYGTDYRYAAVMVTLTTLSSLIFIPVYMALLQ